jgi:hypothetical protein
LAGKLMDNKRAAIKFRTALMQVEAVLQMLRLDFDIRTISAKRRNKSNPWFKRGTLYRSALDVLWMAQAPMTAREIAEALKADKAAPATRKLFTDLQAAVLAALRRRQGEALVGEGVPVRGGENERGRQLRRSLSDSLF